MLQISEICINSIDKGDDSWAVEGDIVFDDDLISAFEATYIMEEDEIEDFSMELDFKDYDAKKLKEMLIQATLDFDEE